MNAAVVVAFVFGITVALSVDLVDRVHFSQYFASTFPVVDLIGVAVFLIAAAVVLVAEIVGVASMVGVPLIGVVFVLVVRLTAALVVVAVDVFVLAVAVYIAVAVAVSVIGLFGLFVGVLVEFVVPMR